MFSTMHIVKERERDHPHDLNIRKTERRYFKGKNYKGPQHPNATGNILCSRYYPLQIVSVSSSLFSTAQKYEICCPQGLGVCGWAAFFCGKELEKGIKLEVLVLAVPAALQCGLGVSLELSGTFFCRYHLVLFHGWKQQ